MLKSSTIIVPCYNESSRINVSTYVDFLLQHQRINMIFVDDGSQDNTLVHLQKIKEQTPEQTTILPLAANKGKAEAVRQGVLFSLKNRTDYVGFWDADLATSLEEIPHFVTLLSDGKRQMVSGSRIKRLGATIERKWYRHYAGRIIATVISMILQLPTYDTQCGAKLFSSELAEEVFSREFISPWLFDVEILARVIGYLGRNKALEIVYEHPLPAWRDIGESKVNLRYIPKIPYELIKIYSHYYETLKK